MFSKCRCNAEQLNVSSDRIFDECVFSVSENDERQEWYYRYKKSALPVVSGELSRSSTTVILKQPFFLSCIVA